MGINVSLIGSDVSLMTEIWSAKRMMKKIVVGKHSRDGDDQVGN